MAINKSRSEGVKEHTWDTENMIIRTLVFTIIPSKFCLERHHSARVHTPLSSDSWILVSKPTKKTFNHYHYAYLLHTDYAYYNIILFGQNKEKEDFNILPC